MTTERRAWDEAGRIAQRELGDIFRMKSVHVFLRIERAHDHQLIDLLWRGQLHEDPVNRRIAINSSTRAEQLGLRGRCRQLEFDGMQSELATHFVLERT